MTLDNGTLLTLGLVGAVAAVGAANQAGVYGSRAESTAPGSRYTRRFFEEQVVPYARRLAQTENDTIQVRYDVGLNAWSHRPDSMQPRNAKIVALVSPDGTVNPGPAYSF